MMHHLVCEVSGDEARGAGGVGADARAAQVEGVRQTARRICQPIARGDGGADLLPQVVVHLPGDKAAGQVGTPTWGTATVCSFAVSAPLRHLHVLLVHAPDVDGSLRAGQAGACAGGGVRQG